MDTLPSEQRERIKLLVSKREAASALSVSVRTIENYIRRKELKVRKLGRRTLVVLASLGNSPAAIMPALAMAMSSSCEAALKRGADELMNLAEHVLRGKPRALKRARKVYETACLQLYRTIKRAQR